MKIELNDIIGIKVEDAPNGVTINFTYGDCMGGVGVSVKGNNGKKKFF